MKFNHLGKLNVHDSLLVTDPCYDIDDSSLGEKLKVKKGHYNCFSLTCRLKEPLFGVDEIEEYFRVAELVISHEELGAIDLDSLNWKKSRKSFCIDSGQGGFFNYSKYQKDLAEESPLLEKAYSFIRESIVSATMEIKHSSISLEKKEADEEYKSLLSNFKNNKEELDQYYSRSIQMNQNKLERMKKFLEEKTLPHYLTISHSKDFYENICSLSSSEFGAGILPDVGVVSQSGLGDCGMDLYTHKDENGEIVACKLVYLKRKEII